MSIHRNGVRTITGHEEYRAKYFKAREQWTTAKNQLANARNKQRDAAESPRSHTFVNSFGEATKRNISSITYERAQRRTQKAILRNMGH